MNFANTLEGWRKHSGNVALIAKSIQFTKNGYSKVVDANTFDEKHINLKDDHDVGRNKKATQVPQRQRERLLVSELLLLSGCLIETPGRKYRRKLFRDSFKNVKTDLKLESTEERARRMEAECRSESKQLLSEMTDDLYREDESGDDVEDAATSTLTQLDPDWQRGR
jgi:hypothetical protein